MNEIITNVTKPSLFKSLPKPIRIALTVLSIITVVFWLCKLIFLILKMNRIVMAYVFEKEHYWTFVICLLMIGLAFAIFYQVEYNAFGKMFIKIKELIVNAIGI